VRDRVPGEALTRRAVTAITGTIAAMTFAFSLGNVTTLCLYLGISAQFAWLPGAAVDLSVVGLLTGLRFLALHGATSAQLRKPRRMLLFCGFLTLALNTAGAVSRQRFGTALVDAVCPALLTGWSEVGPWLLGQVYAASPAPPTATRPVSRPPVLPDELLARARQLDVKHRAATGRPISRDTLRAELQIGRDRAASLVATIRRQPGPEARQQAAAA
jgi:hypothetical protein